MEDKNAGNSNVTGTVFLPVLATVSFQQLNGVGPR